MGFEYYVEARRLSNTFSTSLNSNIFPGREGLVYWPIYAFESFSEEFC